jgi:hypothetical protein
VVEHAAVRALRRHVGGALPEMTHDEARKLYYPAVITPRPMSPMPPLSPGFCAIVMQTMHALDHGKPMWPFGRVR